ncbi:MAG TPA: CehA/McbA family metallohydrolase [Candidatus Acidoferrum sp.]
MEYRTFRRPASIFGSVSCLIWIVLPVLIALPVAAQTRVPLQPFAQQVRQVETSLAYLGQPLAQNDGDAINQAVGNANEAAAIEGLEQILDKYTLAIVEINAESRVKVQPGPAKPELVEAGARIFLVKVINKAGVTARLVAESSSALPVFVQSDLSPEPPKKMSAADTRDRWMDLELYDKDPMSPRLSGLPLEYRILQIYSRDPGQRSAPISFNVGQGTQDVGFRDEMVVVFTALPARPLRLWVRDETGAPSMAAFTIRDALGRLYPNPAKRLAPDLFFQPQVYRENGDTILVPAGSYTVTSSMGPEYHAQTKEVDVTATGSNEVSFAMQRWINPAKYRWYSGDHHVHAAGCSHYQNPTEGVQPDDMVRQIQGEKLNVGAVLTWGPCYYYQKQFFSGKDHPLSKPDRLMHYDLEVSGFPSSHAGHLVLLGLTNQDYPHCVRIEQWPTWDLPVLRWAKSQGASAGFAHSGWGLAVKSRELPNYEVPGFDSIGANEYIVDVTHPDVVDFISTMDTPYPWELNIWYHTLNVGFRTRISGETDFPCITDARVGQGRVYAKVDGTLSYSGWVEALRAGRSYVSDGRSHLMDFNVNNIEVGTNASEVRLPGRGTVHARVRVSAYLSPVVSGSEGIPSDRGNYFWMSALNNRNSSADNIHDRPIDQTPYWHVERARIGNTREVPVELVMNGKPVARKNIVADGSIQDVSFDASLERSSWLAVRILGSSHTNPIFVLVEGKPIRASRRSAQWCLAAVNQCWTQKAPKIATAELADAQAAYDHAREVYTKLIAECAQ